MFKVRSESGEVTSFEKDLVEINPTPFDHAEVLPGETVEIYLLNLSQSPGMYSLTY